MRAAIAILALILACGPAPIESNADPIDAASVRPQVRGNRLIAENSSRAAETLDVTVTSPVAPGDTATASARAPAGSHCQIEVTYRSGPSEAQGLDAETSGEEGVVSWTWIVGINTTPGDWVVDVECIDPEGRQVTGRGLLTVEEAGPAAPTQSDEGGR